MFAPSCLFAQKAEADIKARLVKKPLFLRGQWGSDKLAFDDLGHLQVKVLPVAFTLAGVEIKSVKLTPMGLVLGGQRVGLEFEKDVPKRERLLLMAEGGHTFGEDLKITVQTPTDGDFTTALDAIFTDSIATLDIPLPLCWQWYAQEHNLVPSSVPTAASIADWQSAKTLLARQMQLGKGITFPLVVNQAEPQFSDSAQALKYSGRVLVNLVVEKDGKPSHVQILHALGLGLDDSAVAAVSKYTFQPAMENGKPVAMEMNVEVNFQVF